MDDFGNILKFEHPKWKASLVENLTVLFQSGELCDLYILCRDHKDLNVTFPCHACILASASPVVRNVLLKNDVFGSWTKLALESVGISAREWRYILKYVYTGSVNIQEPHIYAVWKAALYLQIEILVTVLATCIHKYHTKEMELNSPVPELKVCSCNIGSMGSVFVKSQAETMRNSSGIQKSDPNMIQYLPSRVERREKELSKMSSLKVGASEDELSRKRVLNTMQQTNACHQTGVIDLTQTSSCKSEMQYSPEVQQECSSRKKRKMYTPRKVEVKQTNADHEDCSPSVLASVLESPLDNSRVCGNAYSFNSRNTSHDSGEVKPLVQRHGNTYQVQDTTNKGEFNEFRLFSQAKVQQTSSYSNMYSESRGEMVGSLHQEKMPNRETKYSTIYAYGDSNKRLEPAHAYSESRYTDAKPVVIQPLVDEEHPIVNLSLRDRLTSENRYNRKPDRHDSERGHTNVVSSHFKDKPLLSNLLRDPRDSKVAPHSVKREQADETDAPSSSVLKSLLVSNDNLYRSPNKNVGHKPEINIPKRQEKKFPQFHDSSEDEIIFDLEVTDNVEADPDYKPKRGRQPRRKTKSMEKSEKSPVRQNSGSGSSQSKPTVEPYSASSILLSMIRDAETKKVSHSPSTEPQGTTAGNEKDTSGQGKKVILQQPDIRPKAGDKTSSAESKGILRNLLNIKQGGQASSRNKDSKNVSDCEQPTAEPGLSKSPQPLKVPKPSQKSLPFSHVLKNLASVYCSQDASVAGLKNVVTESPSSSVSEGLVSMQQDKSESEMNLGTQTNIKGDEVLQKDVQENDTSPVEEIKKGHSKKNSVNRVQAHLNIEENQDSANSFQSLDINSKEGSESTASGGQTLKLTICKQGQEFKVKDEILSPEGLQTFDEDNNISIENALEINDDASSVDNIDERESSTLRDNLEFEKDDVEEGLCHKQTHSNADGLSLSHGDSEEEQSDGEDTNFSDSDNDSGDRNPSQQKDCVNWDNSEQDKSDAEKESLHREDMEHIDTEDKSDFSVQPHVFPDIDRSDCFAKPSSPEAHTLKIQSYYSIAKPHVDGGYTIVEDGTKDTGMEMTRFTGLFEKDCASSVSESCSDTEVA